MATKQRVKIHGLTLPRTHGRRSLRGYRVSLVLLSQSVPKLLLRLIVHPSRRPVLRSAMLKLREWLRGSLKPNLRRSTKTCNSIGMNLGANSRSSCAYCVEFGTYLCQPLTWHAFCFGVRMCLGLACCQSLLVSMWLAYATPHSCMSTIHLCAFPTHFVFLGWLDPCVQALRVFSCFPWRTVSPAQRDQCNRGRGGKHITSWLSASP